MGSVPCSSKMKTLMDTTVGVGQWLTNELAEVSVVMSEHLNNNHKEVNEICSELAAYKGKMLRPSLLLLSWKSIHPESEIPQQVRVAAGVVELIHLATLVHDDVLDEADLRRGKQTINSLLGNEAAVMLGDFLLSSAFLLCSTIKNPELNLLLGRVTNTLCAGEVVQLTNRNNVDLSLEQYYQIIHDKTASLISACCEMGAVIGGATQEQTATLVEFGELVGAAFQIKDDLLDLLGEREIVGKPTGRDLEKGKITLPIIYMLSKNPDLKPLVRKAMRNNSRDALHRLFESEGAILEAFSVLNGFVDTATRSIESSFENDASNQLCAIAKQLKQNM